MINKFIAGAITGILCIAAGYAQSVVIKSPGYFRNAIRDGHALFPDSMVFDADAEEIRVPDVGMFGR